MRRPSVGRMIGTLVLATIATALALGVAAWWRSTRVIPLRVSLGERFEPIRDRFGAELYLNDRTETSWASITRPHRLTIALPRGPHELPPSRYTVLDFEHGELHAIVHNPHPKALTIDEAQALTDSLCRTFVELGFEVYCARLPGAEEIEERRAAGASRAQWDVAYFRSDSMLIGVALKLHHWRGELAGGVVQLPFGLAYVVDALAIGPEPDDRWLVNLDFLDTERSRPDHTTALGLQIFLRDHPDAGPPDRL